ncbi:MAG: SPOR domain-containing protein [Paludibacteraceae bacterium]|nr:SPOR domain-containing protein [Paludibacteraceae bacterium]
MENKGWIFLIFLSLSFGLVACKVQKAPGAYAPAKNKIPKEKLQYAAADSVDVVPEPERVVRIMAGSEAVDSMARSVVEVEPSIDVVADPEPIIEVTPVETSTVDTIAADTVENIVEEVKETPAPVEPEVARSEKFTVVEGQGNVDLKKYHVVIGSFGKKENAVNLQTQMKPDYNPILVVNERGMFRVLLVSYDTYQEAKAKIVEIQDQFPDAWCLVQQNN